MMVTAVEALSGISIPLPAVEAFPTSLSMIHLAGLNSNLDEQTKTRLRKLEQQLRDGVEIAPILRAQTQSTFVDAFKQAYRKAVGSYIESGILVWRALEYDYSRLLRISQDSFTAIDDLFFTHARKLERETFVNAVTGFRVLAKVGEWRIISEEAVENSSPPLDHLDRVVLATFLTRCVLAYLTGEVQNARQDNLKALADSILEIGDLTYHEAVKADLHVRAKEANHWFWNPEWQSGEVETDLDKRLGDVETFASVEDLVKDLRE